MSLWSRIFGVKQTGAPEPTKAIVLSGLPGPIYLDVGFESFVRNAFKGNDIVNRALCVKAACLAAAPLKAYRLRDDEELPDHPLRRLIHLPNPWMSEYDLWEVISFHLDLGGNAYLQKVRTASRKIAWLWPLRPDRVKALVNPEKGLLAYEHQYGANTQTILPEDIIHIRLNDPGNPWIGTPPIMAARRRIAIDNEATDFTKAILQNKAVPGMAIATEQKLDDVIVERLKERWRQAFGGSRRGEPMFLQKGMTVHTIGLNMQELAFNELNSMDEARILMTLGVPAMVVGAKVGLDRSTFRNAEEARRSLYEDTIEPLMNRIDDIVDRQLVPDFGQDIYTRFDTSELAAYRSVRESRRKEALEGLRSGGLTVNEYRTEMGLQAVGEGDIFLRTIAMMPTPVKVKAVTHVLHGTSRKALSGGTRDLLVRRAVARRESAELWAPKLAEAARTELKRQSEEILRAVDAVPKSLDQDSIESKRMRPDQEQWIIDRLEELKAEWTARMQGEFGPILSAILREAGKDAALDLGVEYLLENEEALAFIRDYGYKFAKKLTLTSVDEVRGVMRRSIEEGLSLGEMRKQLGSVFEGWTTRRAETIARTETIRASARGSEEAWRQNGVKGKEWLVSSDACDFCLAMAEKTNGIGSNYFNQGDSLTIEGVGTMHFDYEDILGPPLHPNCRCDLMPSME